VRSLTGTILLYVSLGVSPILAQTHPANWPPPSITQASWCTPRTEPERHVYSLVGWVRFLKEEVNDNDWHIELTSSRTSPRTSCIVVEIASDDYGQLFAVVRDSLLGVTGLNDVQPKGDTILPTVKIRVTGDPRPCYRPEVMLQPVRPHLVRSEALEEKRTGCIGSPVKAEISRRPQLFSFF